MATGQRNSAGLEDDIRRLLEKAGGTVPTDKSAADIVETVKIIAKGFHAIDADRYPISWTSPLTYAGYVIAALYLRDAGGLTGDARRAANAVAQQYARGTGGLYTDWLKNALYEILGVTTKRGAKP